MSEAIELSIGGISGPTHNYSGLSFGNLASMENFQRVSNPKAAALQELAKMHRLAGLGVKQVILPPHERPFLPLLRSLGYYGSDAEVLEKVWASQPPLLMQCSSSAYMWTANAATVSPSSDSYDHRVHFTPANLISQFHRSFEAFFTGRVLYQLFNHPAYFAHHPPLPHHPDFGDEGAANHTRFCQSFGERGIHLFVFGHAMGEPETLLPKHFPARQTDQASQAIARLHRLDPSHVVFAKQNPEAIDQGVFHNDVIAVGNQQLFLYHEKAFVNTAEVVQCLQQKLETVCQVPLIALEVKEAELLLSEAVATYLFNSELVTLPDKTMALIAPQECERSPSVQALLKRLLSDQSQPIRQVIYQNVQESMQNGGGPACLRLRVVLNQKEYAAIQPSVLFTEELYQKLTQWVEKHYRDKLTPHDLADPQLLKEEQQALDELSHLLQLGPIYSFQRMRPPPPLPEKLS